MSDDNTPPTPPPRSNLRASKEKGGYKMYYFLGTTFLLIAIIIGIAIGATSMDDQEKFYYALIVLFSVTGVYLILSGKYDPGNGKIHIAFITLFFLSAFGIAFVKDAENLENNVEPVVPGLNDKLTSLSLGTLFLTVSGIIILILIRYYSSKNKDTFDGMSSDFRNYPLSSESPYYSEIGPESPQYATPPGQRSPQYATPPGQRSPVRNPGFEPLREPVYKSPVVGNPPSQKPNEYDYFVPRGSRSPYFRNPPPGNVYVYGGATPGQNEYVYGEAPPRMDNLYDKAFQN